MRFSATPSLLISTLLATLCCSSAVAATVYKWVDERGVTHFTSSPPTGVDFSILSPAGNRYPGQEKKPTPQAKPAPVKQPAATKEKSAQASATLHGDEAVCNKVADEIEKLSSVARIKLKTGDTTKILTDEEKQAMLKERRDWYEKYCK